ncbi:MAG: hypothetical protein CM1200mP26_22220 [Acidimicrobiales bacterium]|nr:MAG: hypothetical protein CM1200mP26_22220 [Acidimicrobiales bacterium]
MTFAEAKAWAEQVAAGFAAMGVVAGTPVTWVLPTRVETVVASLALSRLGAVQNPIIHIYRDREVGFCVHQTAAEVVITPGEWNGFDYRAMAERVTADLDHSPTVLDVYDSFPRAIPETSLPSREHHLTGRTLRRSSDGSTTRLAPPRTQRACYTPTPASWPEGWALPEHWTCSPRRRVDRLPLRPHRWSGLPGLPAG